MKIRGDIFSNKSGQLAIFIIMGILLFVGVAIFFLFRGNISPSLSGGLSETNTNSFMESCMESKMRQGIKEISLSGGTQSPLSVNFKFNDDGKYRNISYLCYTSLNYKPCVNQHPNLQKTFQDNLKDYISDDVRNCFSEMKTGFQNNGYDVSGTVLRGFDVKLMQKKISVETQSTLKLSKTDKSSTQENLKFEISSRIYEIAGVAEEIANQESQFCNFDANNFMLTYPEFNIDSFNLQGNGTIFTIQHKDTGEKFRLAVRSCIIPSNVLPA